MLKCQEINRKQNKNVSWEEEIQAFALGVGGGQIKRLREKEKKIGCLVPRERKIHVGMY